MLKILDAETIREAERETVEKESIRSWGLMERAARHCYEWIRCHHPRMQKITFFCGLGNNGGDGLAMARMFCESGISTRVIRVIYSDEMTLDCQANLEKIKALPLSVTAIHEGDDFSKLRIESGIAVDCIWGLGLNRAVAGYWGDLIDYINAHAEKIIAIDMPSGLFSDRPTPEGAKVICADAILTFQLPKLALLLPDNAKYAKLWRLIDIGLDNAYLERAKAKAHYITRSAISKAYRPREKFSHKGTYGHSLLIGGSYGKMGAISLSTMACMRMGSGLTSAHIPEVGYDIVQTRAPEAMCTTGKGYKYLVGLGHIGKPSAVGIGPGLGTHREAGDVLSSLFQRVDCPVVVDADAINALAAHPDLLAHLPENAILTPHYAEFQRLVGTWRDDFEKLQMLRAFAEKHSCLVAYKGAHTVVVHPGGDLFFNSTGNPGMATGGSGDVLTGMLCGLLAQGYSPLPAALMGVYLHGMAADLALQSQSQESLIATDLIAYIGDALKSIA